MSDSNTQRIPSTLDKYLSSEIDLVVYGKSAIHLLFEGDRRISLTNDVDLIVPEVQVHVFDKRIDFWDALEKTNQDLEKSSLYLTHIFDEKQIILQPNWYSNKVKIQTDELNYLNIFVPSPLDLIITKMMRVDPLDRSDIVFIFENAEIKPQDLRRYCIEAVCPDQAGIRDAFQNNKVWLREHGMI
ncbi:hypothetical protein N9N41_06240 [Opitutales bacterium]|nr:hypothetical protein [Opitutales bacterium]